MQDSRLLGSSLPLEPHEGLATVAVTSERESAQLVADPLPRTIARIAFPAVASSLLMTLFFSVDTFWIGTRVGSTGLAAASTAVFWIWLVVSIAEMVNQVFGVEPQVAARRRRVFSPNLSRRDRLRHGGDWNLHRMALTSYFVLPACPCFCTCRRAWAREVVING